MAEPALKPPPSFDTHRTVKAFTDAGVELPTAEALTEGMAIALRHTVTKTDMKSETDTLRQEMQLLRTDMQAEMELLRKDMEILRQDMVAEFKLIREEMSGHRKTAINQIGGIMAVAVTMLLAGLAIATNVLVATSGG